MTWVGKKKRMCVGLKKLFTYENHARNSLMTSLDKKKIKNKG